MWGQIDKYVANTTRNINVGVAKAPIYAKNIEIGEAYNLYTRGESDFIIRYDCLDTWSEIFTHMNEKLVER